MNIKMWNFYKDSEKGKNAIKIFEPESEDSFDNVMTNLAEHMQKLGGMFSVDDMIYSYCQIRANFEAVEEFADLRDNRESFAEFIEIFDLEEAEFTETETKFT